MPRSAPATEESCMRSGGMSDNGIRRGRGIGGKWMDGRTVKEDTAGCGTRPAVLWTFRVTEASEEGSRGS